MHPRTLLPVSFAITLALASWSSSFAALIHSVTPDEQYTALGASLGFVGYQEVDDGSGFRFGGSASLVDLGDGNVGHWILGAAHTSVQIETDRTSTYDSYRFGFSSNFNTPGQTYVADEIFIHPNYGGLQNGPDLALFWFDDKIENIDPVKIYQGNPSDLIGQDAYLAGYGSTGNNETGFTGIDGNKRAGINRLDDIFLGQASSTFRPFGSFRSNPLGLLTGPGDSGGFYGVLNSNELELVGVHAVGFGNGYGGVGSASLVDPVFLSDISSLKSTAVPEPSFLAVFFIGGTFLLIREKPSPAFCEA